MLVSGRVSSNRRDSQFLASGRTTPLTRTNLGNRRSRTQSALRPHEPGEHDVKLASCWTAKTPLLGEELQVRRISLAEDVACHSGTSVA